MTPTTHMKVPVVTLAALVLALAAVLLAGTRPAKASFVGNDGLIAFQSNRDVGGGEIYTMSPTSGTAQRITLGTGGNSYPAFSPDGSKIAFQSPSLRNYEISVMNADGSGARQLTHTDNSAENDPTWSPNGSKIAYSANTFQLDGQTDKEIWVMNADGSDPKPITSNTVDDHSPAWSPLGNKIAFVRQSDKNIYVIDPDGNNETNITPPEGCSGPSCTYAGGGSDPAWSPDGSKIAYVFAHTGNGGGLPDIWLMNPDGSSKINLSNNDSTNDTAPAWSPSGAKIAYVGVASGSTDRNIYVMKADGSAQGPIETDTHNDVMPDWQPIPVCTKSGTAGDDSMAGTQSKDVICGKGGNDILKGLGGNDILLGGPGKDNLQGGQGNDILNGGTEADTASYAGITTNVTPVSASLSTEFATGEGSDSFSYVERLTGTAGADKLSGSSEANVLKGLGGNDALDARDGTGGNDTVDGGAGSNDACQRDRGDAVMNCP